MKKILDHNTAVPLLMIAVAIVIALLYLSTHKAETPYECTQKYISQYGSLHCEETNKANDIQQQQFQENENH